MSHDRWTACERRSITDRGSTSPDRNGGEVLSQFDECGGLSEGAAMCLRRLGRGLPSGLWRSDDCVWTATETPFMFFRNKSTLQEFTAALPALLTTLPPGGGLQNHISVPLVECDKFGFGADVDTSPTVSNSPTFDPLQSSFGTAAVQSSILLQKFTFPLYSDGDEIEDVLVERSINSLRISFRFVAPHVELKVTLQAILASLHHSLSRTFAFEPLKKTSLSAEMSRSHSGVTPLKNATGSLGSTAWRIGWSQFFQREDASRSLQSYLAVSLFRKHPVSTFDLSLVITSQHVAFFSVEALRDRICNILKSIQASVLASAKLIYWKASAIGTAYVDAFEQEMNKMYDLAEG